MALVALLFTILILFIMKGEDIIANPLDALLVAAPLTLYFLIMFTGSWTVCYLAGFRYVTSCRPPRKVC
jgi:ACR3 family arsenite transporter